MSISSLNNTNANSIYGKIASGKRIQTAADDASGLSIANKMKRESNGLDVAADNLQDGIGVANIKDGALDSIQNSLHRIYELSIKASNGLYGQSEKRMIQDEIDQVLDHIESTAVGTKYNGMKLLDGSMADMHIAANPDGRGMKIQMENTTLKELGLDGYSVMGNFDIGDIESAMEKVINARGSTGAMTNRMEHAYNYNTGASLELVSSRSRIEDLDVPKAVSEQKRSKLLQDYRMGMMRKKMENDSLVLKMFGM
jgi:Flagellin and related hook-associated proteins